MSASGRASRATLSGLACTSRASTSCVGSSAEFNLHELAIEDALKAHQRPKVEQYGDALFVVARTAQMLDGRIAFGETHLFVGSGYVVSVRHGASTSYTPVRERCEASPKALSDGEDFILYAILDFIVDNYMPVIETIQDEVEEIEDGILAEAAGQVHVRRLYQLRRDLLRLRNAADPARGGLPAPRAARACPGSMPRCSRSSATCRTTSAGCRRRSSPCARCWPSPSRRA